jgi:hypothetical protein
LISLLAPKVLDPEPKELSLPKLPAVSDEPAAKLVSWYPSKDPWDPDPLEWLPWSKLPAKIHKKNFIKLRDS